MSQHHHSRGGVVFGTFQIRHKVDGGKSRAVRRAQNSPNTFTNFTNPATKLPRPPHVEPYNNLLPRTVKPPQASPANSSTPTNTAQHSASTRTQPSTPTNPPNHGHPPHFTLDPTTLQPNNPDRQPQRINHPPHLPVDPQRHPRRGSGAFPGPTRTT